MYAHVLFPRHLCEMLILPATGGVLSQIVRAIYVKMPSLRKLVMLVGNDHSCSRLGLVPIQFGCNTGPNHSCQ